MNRLLLCLFEVAYAIISVSLKAYKRNARGGSVSHVTAVQRCNVFYVALENIRHQPRCDVFYVVLENVLGGALVSLTCVTLGVEWCVIGAVV